MRVLAGDCLREVPIESQTMTPRRRIGQTTDVVEAPQHALYAGPPEQPFDRFEFVIAGRVEIRVPHPHRIAGSAWRTAVEPTGCHDTGHHAVANQKPGALQSMS